MQKNGMQQSLHRGLAIAAGQGQHHGRTRTRQAGGDFTERFFGIGTQDGRQIGIHRTMRQQGCSAVGFGLGDEFMGIEALAFQGNEQRPVQIVAAVGADA